MPSNTRGTAPASTALCRQLGFAYSPWVAPDFNRRGGLASGTASADASSSSDGNKSQGGGGGIAQGCAGVTPPRNGPVNIRGMLPGGTGSYPDEYDTVSGFCGRKTETEDTIP